MGNASRGHRQRERKTSLPAFPYRFDLVPRRNRAASELSIPDIQSGIARAIVALDEAGLTPEDIATQIFGLDSVLLAFERPQ